MTKIKIFKDNTEIDLEKLIESRLLFFANSGGGKSWAFRKFLEEINNKIMVIIGLQSGIDRNVSTFKNGIYKLNTLQLIEINGDQIKASGDLFND